MGDENLFESGDHFEALNWYADALHGQIFDGRILCAGPHPACIEVNVRLNAGGKYSIFPADYDDPLAGDSAALRACYSHFNSLIKSKINEVGEPPRINIRTNAERISDARYLWRMTTDEMCSITRWYYPYTGQTEIAARAPFTLARQYMESRAITIAPRFAQTTIGALYGGYCGWDGYPGSPRGYGDFELTESFVGGTHGISIDYLVCAMRNVLTDELTAAHRTFFRRLRTNHWIPVIEDGVLKPKKKRRVCGVAKNAAIKFFSDQDVRAARMLVIGEGVETCLSAIQLGWSPVWAAASTYNIAHFPLIRSIDRLIILGENDEHGASRRAYSYCAERWRSAGKRVDILLPHKGFNDFNDQLAGRMR